MSKESEKFNGGNWWTRRMDRGQRLGHETTFIPTLLMTAAMVVMGGIGLWAANQEFHWFKW